MSRANDMSQALSESLEEFDDTLRGRVQEVRARQQQSAGHLIDVNDHHETTKEQVGAGNIENYPVANSLIIAEGTSSEHYVDMEGAIQYIRNNLNVARIVVTGDPISPIGGVGLNTLKPKLRGGSYVNGYGIPRDHRHFQLRKAADTWDNAVLDVEINADDLVLPSNLENTTDYVWRYQDHAEDGEKGPWKEADFRIQYEIVLTPTITIPGGATEASVRPTFVGSPFEVSTGSDTHTSSVWTLYDAQGAVVETKTISTGNLREWTPSTVLDIVSDYAVELYYTAASYETSGTAREEFTTRDAQPNPPIITIPNAPTGPFSIAIRWDNTDPVDLDTHQSSSLELFSDSQFTNKVFEIHDTEGQKTSVQINNLADLTTYYVRAKVYGPVTGYSSWRSASFTTGVMEGQATEFEESGDVDLYAGAGDGQNSALGGGLSQSPMQPYLLYRNPQGVLWSQKMEGLVDEGAIEGVAVIGSRIIAYGNQETPKTPFVVCLNKVDGSVLWVKYVETVHNLTLTGIAAATAGDYVFLSGYSNQFNGTGQDAESAIAMGLSLTTGEHRWTRVYGGENNDAFYDVTVVSGNYPVFVGRQSSNHGDNAQQKSHGFIVRLRNTGGPTSEHSTQFSSTDDYFETVTNDGVNAYPAGRFGANPGIAVYRLSDLEIRSARRSETLTNASFVDIQHRDGELYGTVRFDQSPETCVLKLSAEETPNRRWCVEIDHAEGAGKGLVTNNGYEILSGVTKGGERVGLAIRIPESGSVGSIPNMAYFNWGNRTTDWLVQSNLKVADIGPWSNWTTHELGKTKNSSYNSTPPTIDQYDADEANANGYLDVGVTRETGNLGYFDPTYYSYQTHRWVDQNQYSFIRNFTYRPATSTFQGMIPSDTSTTRYRYDGYDDLGSYVEDDWGSWTTREWYSGWVHDTAGSAFTHAGSHKNAVLNDAAADPYHEVNNFQSFADQNTEGMYRGRLRWQRRDKAGTTVYYKYRIKYTQQTRENYTVSGYRWTLRYEYRTRTYVPIDVLGLSNTVPFLDKATPIITPTTPDIRYGNF